MTVKSHESNMFRVRSVSPLETYDFCDFLAFALSGQLYFVVGNVHCFPFHTDVRCTNFHDQSIIEGNHKM